MLQVLTVGEVMQPLGAVNANATVAPPSEDTRPSSAVSPALWAPQLGDVLDRRRPQALLGDETLEQALRQLVLYGPEGLPVLSPDRHHVVGWVTHRDVIHAMVARTTASDREVAEGALAAEWAAPDAKQHLRVAPAPLEGYDLVEIQIGQNAPVDGRRVDEIDLPTGGIVAAITVGPRTLAARSEAVVHAGNCLLCLVPASTQRDSDRTSLDGTILETATTGEEPVRGGQR